MALTGHLSDLSLSELIEFFCNQRKTGQLKVLYPKGSGHFYLQTGSVVDAQIGVLRGIDAVYYALTLPNAHFEFSASPGNVEKTINQPWTQVVLEGLRRLDEGITPPEAFPEDFQGDTSPADEPTTTIAVEPEQPVAFVAPSFLSYVAKDALARNKPFVASAVAIAVLASIAAAGVPAGWYDRALPTGVGAKTISQAPEAEPDEIPLETGSPVEESANVSNEEPTVNPAKRQRDRVKPPAAVGRSQSVSTRAASDGSRSTTPRKVTVSVTYDESGRVTQASGGDPTALRIARQKRFPPGKAGSATVTIPIN